MYLVMKEFKGSKFVIICPHTMISSWIAEIDKWCGVRIAIAETKELFLNISGTVVLILSYESAKLISNDEFSNTVKLRIFDEGHRLGNSSSKLYESCEKIPGEFTLVMTGTLIANNLTEYRGLINFVKPNALPIDDKLFKQYYPMSIEGFSNLREKTKCYVLRRSTQILRNSLPKRTIVNVFFNKLTQMQTNEYAIVVSEHDNRSLVKAAKITNISLEIINSFRTKTTCTNPSAEDIIQSSSKIALMKEFICVMIKENSDEKVIIMSHGTDTFLNIFEIVLREFQIHYAYVGDGRSVVDTENELKKFNDNDKCRVILVSTKAGGCGLNLSRGKYLFLTDLDWNPAVDSQAMGRNYRIGQTMETFVFKLIASNTIDESIYLQQELKEVMASTVMNEELPLYYQSLNEEDINDALKSMRRTVVNHLGPGVCQRLRVNSSTWSQFHETICPIFFESQKKTQNLDIYFSNL